MLFLFRGIRKGQEVEEPLQHERERPEQEAGNARKSAKQRRLTKAIASPSKFAKFQAVLLGEQKATASATALVAKSAVRGAEARCFLVRPL